MAARYNNTAYTYDAAGRISTVDRFDSHGKKDSQTHQYNYASEKIATIDRFGNTTTYHYDDLGRLISTIFPVVKTKSHFQSPSLYYTYDILNNITESIDAHGYKVCTCYNAYNKPIEKIYPDGTKEFFYYNLDGSLKKAIDKKNMTSYEYDIFGRETFIQIQDAISHVRFSLASTYLLSI